MPVQDDAGARDFEGRDDPEPLDIGDERLVLGSRERGDQARVCGRRRRGSSVGAESAVLGSAASFMSRAPIGGHGVV
jgi:hypothetical protein